MKKLHKEDETLIEQAADALEAAAQEARDYFDEKSEKWQESDAGVSYSAWAEELENAADVLRSLPTSPSGEG